MTGRACDQAPLEALVRLLSSDPAAPTSVRGAEEVRRVHIADSLSGLEVPELSSARRICDIGAGAGLPALVLAAALPEAGVDAIEASSRKCSFMERAIELCGLPNAHVVCARAEEHAAADGREAYEVACARAVAPLASLAELASPLLCDGGVLVAWKGRRDSREESAAGAASARTAMRPLRVQPAEPYPGSRDRHLHVMVKVGPTPPGLPRRPGRAQKRPFGDER